MQREKPPMGWQCNARNIYRSAPHTTTITLKVLTPDGRIVFDPNGRTLLEGLEEKGHTLLEGLAEGPHFVRRFVEMVREVGLHLF